MRVALFTDTPRMGGAERVLIDLAEAACAAGHDVCVLTPQRWLAESIATGSPGVRARVIARDIHGVAASRADVGRVLGLALPAMVRTLRHLAPDVLHVSNGGYPGSELCRLMVLAARLAGVRRRVLTVHAVPRPRGSWQPLLQGGADRAVWASLDAVVGATTIVRERLHALRGMPAQLFVKIPYGVAEPGGAQAGAALRAALAAPDELLVGMVAATSDAQKGHAVLADALAGAAGIQGVIVGAEPPPEARARIAAAGLGARLTIAGRVDAVGPYLRALDALVLPSIADESLPLVVLEAMACGTPVIASRLSGIPEAVVDGRNGHLFEPGDAAALAMLLRRVRDDRAALRRLGVGAREDWQRRFSVAAMTDAHLRLYARPAPPSR